MAPRLKQFIHEVHRRSLWQVLTIYLGASWAVLEAVDQVTERYLLPEWVYPAAIILLLIGLPIVLATAFVREDLPAAHTAASVAPESGVESQQMAAEHEPAASRSGQAVVAAVPAPLAWFLTWRRAILGGVLAFTALGLISAWIVIRGAARVTEAYGAAGDAFQEREWMIVTEFETPEGEGEVGLAAREALTIDLQQSQFVNVFGRDQLGPVLRRMDLADTTTLDRRLALEVAEREGLAAVLAGRVSRLGDDYVFAARVIQPGSGRELIAVRTAARAERLLEGVESLSREVRRRLGEEGEGIRRSRPLPEVTTRSLEALKTYARAVAVLERENDASRAAELAEEAARLDSTFAMAYRLASVAHNNAGRFGESIEQATRAYELRQRLTDRERLHVEAFYYQQVPADMRRAAETYELIVSQYPDDSRASNNLGVVSGLWLGDFERAYQAYHRALGLNPNLSLGYTNSISAALVRERWATVDSLIAAAGDRGFGESVGRHRMTAAFASGELARVESLCDSLSREASNAGLLAGQRVSCGSVDIARGRFERGVDRLAKAASYYMDSQQFWMLHQTVGALVLAEQMRGRPAAANARLESMLARFPADSMSVRDRFYVATGLQVVAGLLGRHDLADQIETIWPPAGDVPEWLNRYGDALAGAAKALSADDSRSALQALEQGTGAGPDVFFWAPWRNLLYGLAYESAAATDSAIARLEAAVAPGLLAQWWQVPSQTNLPFVLLRLGELEEARGNREAAAGHYQRFLELWSDADPEVADRVAAARRALARVSGVESSD